MSVLAKCIVNARYVPNADTTIYTAPASTHTIIDKFTALNTDSSSHTLAVNIIPSGDGVDAENLIIQSVTIAAGAVFDSSEIKNQILNSGDILSVNASAASMIVVRVSGREVT